ncbi:hypothetical protein BHE74_00050266 [Ensete ventricosum]|nr:hypothetical protein BHE74_00050266 [Ensete ventricosum]
MARGRPPGGVTARAVRGTSPPLFLLLLFCFFFLNVSQRGEKESRGRWPANPRTDQLPNRYVPGGTGLTAR